MNKNNQNFDPNESFDEAMSPVNFAESSDSSNDDVPLKRRSVQKAKAPAASAPTEGAEEISYQKFRASETKHLLKYLKDYPFTPAMRYEAYYSRYLELNPNVTVSWQSLYARVMGMRRQYRLTKKWLHENVADIDENDIEKEVKLRCPFYYELDEVFKDKVFSMNQSPQVSGVRKTSRDTCVRENGVKEEQFPIGIPDRMDDLATRRLEFEKRKLNFDKMKFEREKSLTMKRFLFDTAMQQKEMELKMYEVETKRMYVENMMEVQKLRLEKEERIKRLRIEMDSKYKRKEVANRIS